MLSVTDCIVYVPLRRELSFQSGLLMDSVALMQLVSPTVYVVGVSVTLNGCTWKLIILLLFRCRCF